MAEEKALEWFPVGPVEELKKQKCRKLYADSGNHLALFYLRSSDKDKFYASSASCPHAKGPLEQGDIEELGSSVVVTCPMHFYTFDLETGVHTCGDLKLPVYETNIRNGQVYVKAAEQLHLKSAAKRAKEAKEAAQEKEHKASSD